MAANYYKYNANMGDRTYFTSVVTTTNGGTKRYFSNVESEIYFGDVEMEDIYQFEFGIDEKSLPIYGYNCYYATELVSGNRIVQGQFVVNYTDTMLIQRVLGNIEDSIHKQPSEESYFPGGDLHHAIYNKEFDIMIGYGYYNVKDKQTFNATSQSIIGAKITGMHKVVDTTGQPLLEVFTFVAKDFIEENITQASTGTTEPPKEEEKEEENTIDIPYFCSNESDEDTVIANRQAARETGINHFVHSLYLDQGLIKLSVWADDYNTDNRADTIDTALIECKIRFDDGLDSILKSLELEFDSVAGSTAEIAPKPDVFDALLKAEEKYDKLNCTLEYVIEVQNERGSMDKIPVTFEGAVLILKR